MLHHFKIHWPKLSKTKSLVGLIMLLTLTSLACSLGGQTDSPKAIRIRSVLPTLTPVDNSEPQAVAVAETPTPLAEPSAASQDSTGSMISTNSVVPTRTPLPTLTPTTVSPPVIANANALAQPANSSSSAPVSLTPAPNPTTGSLPAAPTSTATVPLPLAPNPTATPSPVAPTPTATVPSPSNPTPTATPVYIPSDPSLPPVVDDWSFVGVRTLLDVDEAVVIGELINNTGIPQTDIHVSALFYNEQHKLIEEQVDTLSYVPVEVIPAGGRVPFELIADSTVPIYRVNLYAMSEPSGNAPSLDFQFSNVSHWTDTEMYCLGGEVQNTDTLLEDFLIILASTYNKQGQLASFGEYAVASPEIVVGDQTSSFELCIDPLDQYVTQHKLIAMGY